MTLLVIGVQVQGSARSLRALSGFETRELALERACGAITHLDEVLTMSARMCAATGEIEWEERYLEHVALLDEAIAAAHALDPGVWAVPGSEQTDQANQRLVALELEAFDLVRAGRAPEAAELLSSEAYERDKAVYAEGNARSLAALRAALSASLESARRRGGQERLVMLVSMPLLALQWLFVARSIRAHIRRRRAVELRLRDYADELERASEDVRRAAQARSDFFARVSHEIRTPMGGVLGAAELLEASRLEADQRELLGMVRSSGALLLAIVDDVLDVSKIEAGKLSVAPVPCDVAALAREVAGVLRPRAEAKGLFLAARVEPDGPVRVLADPVRLRQILFNLIGNALKFTQQGGVELVLEHSPTESGAVALCFAVRDTGVGIAPQALARIFESFSQADDTIAARFGGTGLGLTICRELVHLMQGSIRVKSEPGAGTEFRVALEAPPAPLAPVPAALPSRGSFHGARVLVAEDNPVNQVVARRMLERLGCAVEIVADGRACLEAAERARFDLILLDCHMPVMDGFAAARELRAREEAATEAMRLPIVALTASALPDDVQACRAAGMDDVVTKPFTEERLRTALERWLPLGEEARAA